jgi:hypothetical protein
MTGPDIFHRGCVQCDKFCILYVVLVGVKNGWIYVTSFKSCIPT